MVAPAMDYTTCRQSSFCCFISIRYPVAGRCFDSVTLYGFHMADLNSALQVMLAFKHVLINLLIGTTTVFVLWFCSEEEHSVPGSVRTTYWLSGLKRSIFPGEKESC